jgi:hypothetical protein
MKRPSDLATLIVLLLLGASSTVDLFTDHVNRKLSITVFILAFITILWDQYRHPRRM